MPGTTLSRIAVLLDVNVLVALAWGGKSPGPKFWVFALREGCRGLVVPG